MTIHQKNRIEQFILNQGDQMIQLLARLVKMESPTSEPDAQGAILNAIKCELESLEYNVSIIPGNLFGGHLIGNPKGTETDNNIQLLIGHCDTVWPLQTLKSMPYTSENGRISGPGVFDMKAGLVQTVYALKAIKSLELRPSLTPVVLINSDEEKGSKESESNIIKLAKKAARAYVMEPPLGLKGKLKTARKGLGKFVLTVEGLPAHAGLDPSKGASAILELSHQIQELFQLNDPLKGISVNVGMIEGGTRPNVIAPSSKAIVDVRVMTQDDAQTISQKIMSLKPVNPNTKITVEGSIGRPPMEKTKRNQKLWEAAKLVGQGIGMNLEEGTAGGGSDGNTTSQYTATLDGLGIPGDGAHARHEFIFKEGLKERTILLTHLILMDQ